ncbi:MAG: phage terminase large subunit [Candidatus Gastranaerophilales bacterium]|nr:phage terminase large subunit [Candidatus Gastranaerophilales bacterium]
MTDKNDLAKAAFYATLRNDLYAFICKAFQEIDNSQPFCHNWHLELLADRLTQCKEGKIKRLIVNVPPRSLKTHSISIAFVAWLLGHSPAERIICCSYAQDLANKISRDCLKLMRSDFFKKTFGETGLNPDKQSEGFFETTKNGYRFATSVMGALTGLGGNFIIVDDPIKAEEANSEVTRRKVNEWYNTTLSSRLNNKAEGVIIVVMQRLHVDDLTGHLLKQDGWTVLSLPAIAENDESFTLSSGKVVGRKKGEALNPKLEDIKVLENHRKLAGNYIFSAQYQQRPIPAKGNIIDFDSFGRYSSLPFRAYPDKIYQSWDIALSTGENNDYSACVTAHLYGEVLHIVDVFRCKLAYPELKQKIFAHKQDYRPHNLIIEQSSISLCLISELKKMGLAILEYRPDCDKVTRAVNSTIAIAEKKVLLPNSAPWLEDFRNEMIAFPMGAHDDQVDAFTQLMAMVTKDLENNRMAEVYKGMADYNSRYIEYTDTSPYDDLI